MSLRAAGERDYIALAHSHRLAEAAGDDLADVRVVNRDAVSADELAAPPDADGLARPRELAVRRGAELAADGRAAVI